MRPPCPDGVIIANGMLYWGPWMCQCPLSFYGHIGLAPAGKFNYRAGRRRVPLGARRRRSGGRREDCRSRAAIGPATKAITSGRAVTPIACPRKSSGSGSSSRRRRPGPRPRLPPATWFSWATSAGCCGRWTPSSGKLKWEAYTAGAIFLSPAVWEGRVYVGSADGRVYAFEAATGRRLWTFRAAPADRWIPVYGKLHSTWPVAGGVVVDNGVVYAAAGIANYDGTHVYALDAITGKLKWYNDSSGSLSKAREGVSLQGELSLARRRLCFPGGTMCRTASYDLKTGECRSKLRRGQLTVFDAYYSRYGASCTNLSHTLSDGGRLVYAYDVRRGGNATDLTMLRPLKADEAVPAKPVASDVLWTCRGRSYNGFIIGPNSLLAAGSDGVKRPVEHFVAAVKLADGADLWYQRLPASAVKCGTAVDHAGRMFVALDDGRVICLGRRPPIVRTGKGTCWLPWSRNMSALEVTAAELAAWGVPQDQVAAFVAAIAALDRRMTPGKAWQWITRNLLGPGHPMEVHEQLYARVFADWNPADGPPPAWFPEDPDSSNIAWLMRKAGAQSYHDLYAWSVSKRREFWATMVERLEVQFREPFRSVLELPDGPEHPRWLAGAN